jgi:hypothetical protein
MKNLTGEEEEMMRVEKEKEQDGEKEEEEEEEEWQEEDEEQDEEQDEEIYNLLDSTTISESHYAKLEQSTAEGRSVNNDSPQFRGGACLSRPCSLLSLSLSLSLSQSVIGVQYISHFIPYRACPSCVFVSVLLRIIFPFSPLITYSTLKFL